MEAEPINLEMTKITCSCSQPPPADGLKTKGRFQVQKVSLSERCLLHNMEIASPRVPIADKNMNTDVQHVSQSDKPYKPTNLDLLPTNHHQPHVLLSSDSTPTNMHKLCQDTTTIVMSPSVEDVFEPTINTPSDELKNFVPPMPIKPPVKSPLKKRGSLIEGNFTHPKDRFINTDEIVGRGSFKTVYKGLDQKTGVAVAWCELNVNHVYEYLYGHKTKSERKREMEIFKEEVGMLKTLQHANIVRFYDSWEYVHTPSSTKKSVNKIVLVTELMTSGTLKQYIKKLKTPSIKIITNWCRHILKGLLYLHTRHPPVIHRDLKCDNIFINGQNGFVKIGDLGLATFKTQNGAAQSVKGTPEFMAPEMYGEKYDEAVDVYAFGMCLLEMVTNEYPYQECTHPGQIWRKVTEGIAPHSLEKVTDSRIKSIIENCIKVNPEHRPSVKDLLRDPFFDEWEVQVKHESTSQPDKIKFTVTDELVSRPEMNEYRTTSFVFDVWHDDVEFLSSKMVEAGYLHTITQYKAATSMKHHIAEYRQMMKHTPSRPASRRNSFVNETSSSVVFTVCDKNGVPEMKKLNRVERESSLKDMRKSVVKKSKISILSLSRTNDGIAVECKLSTGLKTIAFDFDWTEQTTAEEITHNLVESGELQRERIAATQKQLTDMIDLIKSNQSELSTVKDTFNAKGQSENDTFAPPGKLQLSTPRHSRDFELTEEALNQPVKENSKLSPLTPPIQATLEISSDAQRLRTSSFNVITQHESIPDTRTRTVSWTAHTSPQPVRANHGPKYARLHSVPNKLNLKPLAAELETLRSAPSTPVCGRKNSQVPADQESLNKAKGDDLLLKHLRHIDDDKLNDLSRSLENILSKSGKGSRSDDGQHSTISKPRSNSGRKLSDDSSVFSSPNTSQPVSNSNSLTCSSTASISRHFETNKKSTIVSSSSGEPVIQVGRFSVGRVDEVTDDLPDSGRANSSDLMGVDSVQKVEKIVSAAQNSEATTQLSSNTDNELHKIIQRQKAEYEDLQRRHKLEVSLYKAQKTEWRSCNNCSQLKATLSKDRPKTLLQNKSKLCPFHSIAFSLRQQSFMHTSPANSHQTPITSHPFSDRKKNRKASQEEIHYVADLLRNNQRCPKLQSELRGEPNGSEFYRGRKRHSSVQQILQRVMSVSSEDDMMSPTAGSDYECFDNLNPSDNQKLLPLQQLFFNEVHGSRNHVRSMVQHLTHVS